MVRPVRWRRICLSSIPPLQSPTIGQIRPCERRPALRGEDKERLRILLPGKPAKCTQFMPRIGCVLGEPLLARRTASVPAPGNRSGSIASRPVAGAESVAVSDQNHSSVAVALGGLGQAGHLGVRQILAGPYSAFLGRRGVATVRFLVAGATSFRRDFAKTFRAPAKLTVRIISEKRTAGKAGGCPEWWAGCRQRSACWPFWGKRIRVASRGICVADRPITVRWPPSPSRRGPCEAVAWGDEGASAFLGAL
jgi:hypothetical protein